MFVLTPRKLDGGDAEGFGMVYLEASLFGLPIVASNSGGVPEAVLDKKTGLIVDPENKYNISQAIIKLLEDKNLAIELAKKGKQRILREFKWEKQLEKILYV